jgi:hypothetical protein
MQRHKCPHCGGFLCALTAKSVTAGAEFVLVLDLNCPKCKKRTVMDVFVKGPQNFQKKSVDDKLVSL